jgi:hypothetical protein
MIDRHFTRFYFYKPWFKKSSRLKVKILTLGTSFSKTITGKINKLSKNFFKGTFHKLKDYSKNVV